MAISLKSLLVEETDMFSSQDRLPSLPTLTPDQEKATVDEFNKLDKDKKKTLISLLRMSCAWCESEFKVHNLADSHGICRRHFRNATGREPASVGSGKFEAPDLEKIDPKLIHLAERIHAMAKNRRKRAKEVTPVV